MYADIDLQDKMSLLELSKYDVSILTEALVRYAVNPDIPSKKRNHAKYIAYLITKENGKSVQSSHKEDAG